MKVLWHRMDFDRWKTVGMRTKDMHPIAGTIERKEQGYWTTVSGFGVSTSTMHRSIIAAKAWVNRKIRETQ